MIYNKKELSLIIKTACVFGLSGFGGKCAAAAMALNRILFKDKAVYVLVVNEALWIKGNHFAGHVAIRFDGYYWDADGRPKSLSEIEDFGSLDHEDPYYAKIAKENGIRWDEKTANASIVFELDDESEVPFGHDDVSLQCEYVKKAVSHLKRRCLI